MAREETHKEVRPVNTSWIVAPDVRRARLPTLACLCLLMVACASTREPTKQELLLGAWRAESQGQTTTLVYRERQVEAREFGILFPYEWVDADHIRLDALGQEVVSHIDFETPDIMRQTSEGSTQLMYRIP